MNNRPLPNRFYDLMAKRIMADVKQKLKQGLTLNEASALSSYEHEIEWLNREFPEAVWIHNPVGNTIYAEFKSPELETFFRLKWE